MGEMPAMAVGASICMKIAGAVTLAIANGVQRIRAGRITLFALARFITQSCLMLARRILTANILMHEKAFD